MGGGGGVIKLRMEENKTSPYTGEIVTTGLVGTSIGKCFSRLRWNFEKYLMHLAGLGISDEKCPGFLNECG